MVKISLLVAISYVFLKIGDVMEKMIAEITPTKRIVVSFRSFDDV